MSVSTFFKQTKSEMSHVKWISSKQVLIYTATVIVVSLAVAYLLGAFDFVLETGLKQIITR